MLTSWTPSRYVDVHNYFKTSICSYWRFAEFFMHLKKSDSTLDVDVAFESWQSNLQILKAGYWTPTVIVSLCERYLQEPQPKLVELEEAPEIDSKRSVSSHDASDSSTYESDDSRPSENKAKGPSGRSNALRGWEELAVYPE
ncbi:hypothetical protein BGZ54_004994 [Gamsiella multidivaricata]|nr:hypothetical protein BGZ54_004994 [Gamsiella multidivaricata]